MPIHTSDQGWVLETERSAYALGLNEAGRLAHRYWGPRLPFPEDYPPAPDTTPWASFNGPAQRLPEEYPAYGGLSYVEPCLKVTFADGTRDTDLAFAGVELRDSEVPELVILLRDAAEPLEVALHYRLHAASDLIERWAELRNTGVEPLLIERAFSAQWHLPPGERYRLTHLAGRWFDEFQIQREPLLPGVKLLESRRLTTSHHHSPWFALDRGGADEDSGAVWFGTLGWSGNWKITAEATDFGNTRLGIGLNDWDFAWRLTPGEIFATPPAYGGYTDAGFGGASRALHDFTRALLPHGPQIHQVLYNSWEATLFDVDERSQGELAERAAALGVELFVMDDGWFHGRNSDNAGLGDWWPDARKFPQGLAPLIARVNALGMDFGLWIEPEMVNPDSDLYRAHPDWVIHFPSRPRTESRNQLILNLARQDVQDMLIARLDTLLAEHNITFIKWDMNRNVSEPGWPDAPGDPRELWVRYVQGVYRVWETLRARHPQVIWQSCSGGGGRADLGILRMADQIWVSDNTDALARLRIQEGFSQLFPANVMEAWVTDTGADRVPLPFRFHVSMCGTLGVGAHLLRWSPEEQLQARKLIADYKAVRHIVQQGDQFRLRSPHQHAFSAVQYVAKDRSEGVLFAFRTHLPIPAELPPLYLRGLDPQVRYSVDGIAGARSGAAWMHSGLTVDLADFESTMRRIRRVD
ncbi:MAG: alpha-galactosidase [Roseiflexaceae bacterium]